MESIKQKPSALGAPVLPDFRNLGVILRVLLLANLLAAVTVLIRIDEPARLLPELALMAGRVELPLLLTVLLLYLLAPALRKLHARSALAVLVVAAVVVVSVLLSTPLLGGADEGVLRPLAWAVGVAALVLLYFDYRTRRYSPALAEARLLALTARIRPHFFFNSLNGVLGVMRSDPQRAERALEELADLFRALMQDNRDLVSLRDEIALCERYIGLERLRLGDRLAVRWEIEGREMGPGEGSAAAASSVLLDARVPPLLLQPLVENAIYHGVEPGVETGEVIVRVGRQGEGLRLEVDNPVGEGVQADRHHVGNHMALDNIRERLMLFFDLEARLDIELSEGRYRVSIRMPFRRQR
jgi:two-component system, LytTR family, sensor histidine kinase AlgZ